MKKGLTIGELQADQTYEYTVRIDEEMIEHFAKATGDYNPIHLDEEYAKGSIFKSRVAHGMLSAGVLSGVIGTQFPGIGTIYLSQTIKFLKPVFIGDQLTLYLRVLEIREAKNRLRLETVGTNQRNERVFEGEALIMPPPA